MVNIGMHVRCKFLDNDWVAQSMIANFPILSPRGCDNKIETLFWERYLNEICLSRVRLDRIKDKLWEIKDI